MSMAEQKQQKKAKKNFLATASPFFLKNKKK